MAEAVQSGFLKFVWQDCRDLTEARTRDVITTTLGNIKHHVLFVRTDDDPNLALQKAQTTMMAHSPDYFGVGGRGDASSKAREVANQLPDSVLGYELQGTVSEGNGYLGVLELTDEFY